MEEVQTIIQIILPILAFVASFVAYYFNIKSKLQSAANSAINHAEDTDKENEEKFKQAVDEAMALIPTCVKPFISRSMVEVLIQKAFDEIDEFAKKQIEKESK